MLLSSDYAARVPLVACPFCREMFEEGEQTSCPLCGVALTAFEKLPPSHDAHDVTEDGVPLAPEHAPLPRAFMGRGRGALTAFALVGIALFFLPWIQMTLPETVAISGFDLARRLGWSWGSAVSWVVLVPTVLSRRSIAQLRGARVAAVFLCLVPAVTIGILLARPPHGGLVPVRFTYDWPLYATLAVSLASSVCAALLGGRVDDITVTRGTSQGQALH